MYNHSRIVFLKLDKLSAWKLYIYFQVTGSGKYFVGLYNLNELPFLRYQWYTTISDNTGNW